MKIEWTLKRRIKARKEKLCHFPPYCNDFVKYALENRILVNPNMEDYIRKHSQKGGHLYREW